MIFGPEDRFRVDLDHLAAAMVFEKPLGVELPSILMMTEPGRAAQVCKFIGHPPAAYFMYRARSPEEELRKKPGEALRDIFGDFKGPMPAMLDAFNESGSTYFDRVSQIHMDRWTAGRIVLVGDSAYCPNLYSGQGAGMGIFGAELLGTVLQNHPTDVPAALQEWEARVRPEADRQQKAGLWMKHIFVPGNRPTYFARKLFMLTLQTPGLEAIVDRVLFANN
jgi:2-polyprenyl-6-methoxyphenol hydroxylase-like FAD-dependent oxidoreductase